MQGGAIVILGSAANLHECLRRLKLQKILQILITQILHNSTEVQTCQQSGIQENIIFR